ncbi:MAG: long-chain fatty acid transporter [Gammaproteobacteria bacterium]|nr:long-chain fatty acid transporter [Gammaproteobacteria bacterium]
MKYSFKLSLATVAVSALLTAPVVQATNGYFSIGYGAKARGMGGVGVALPQDAIAGATNPAGIAFTGNRIDVGLELFQPFRSSTLDARGLDVNAATAGAVPGQGMRSTVKSGANLFAVPNFGAVMRAGKVLTFGLSAVGAGGMNTRYSTNPYSSALAPVIGDTSSNNFGVGGQSGFAGMYELMGGNVAAIDANLAMLYNDPTVGSTAGVNLAQLIVAPTVAYSINKKNSVGASLLLGYQRFRAYGLGLFRAFSADQANLTNVGDDQAFGLGVRVGWTGKVTNELTLGATAASKIYMQKFKKYSGLFAEGGAFDIPANFALGLAYKASDKVTLAFDVERILYTGVAAISNPGPTADEFFNGLTGALTGPSSCGAGGNEACVTKGMGNSNGFGFGWDDMTVYKLGVDYVYSKQWTFRGGFNYGKSPIANKENLFNILAPGVVERQMTLGFTYSPSRNNEITVGYMHAFRKDQSNVYAGTGGFTGFNYQADIGMSQNSLDVSYAWKF